MCLSYCRKPFWESDYSTCGLHAPDHTQSVPPCQTLRNLLICWNETLQICAFIINYEMSIAVGFIILMNLLMIVFVGEARRRNGQNLPIVFGHTDYGLWLVHGCNLFNFSHSLPSSPPSILPSYSPLGYAHVPKDSQQSRWNPPPPLPRLSQLTLTGLGFGKRMVCDWMSTSFYKMWFERNSLTTLIGTISDCIRLIRMVQLSSIGSNSQYDPQNSPTEWNLRDFQAIARKIARGVAWTLSSHHINIE